MGGARERLAEALEQDPGHGSDFYCEHYDTAAVLADLLPVVQALVAEGQAEALEAEAFGVDQAADEDSGWCGPWHDLADGMRARAAALRATTSGEGTP